MSQNLSSPAVVIGALQVNLSFDLKTKINQVIIQASSLHDKSGSTIGEK